MMVHGVPWWDLFDLSSDTFRNGCKDVHGFYFNTGGMGY